jgi:hypothetical protein
MHRDDPGPQLLSIKLPPHSSSVPFGTQYTGNDIIRVFGFYSRETEGSHLQFESEALPEDLLLMWTVSICVSIVPIIP